MSSIINCRVCQHENSEGAKHCVKCGAANPSLDKPNYGKGFVMGALMLPIIVIGAVLALI